ncbi:hypothetical protein ACIBP6_44145 [Nonomuraea terrae]|uniref:hypothetical protein n=1 Tax=Nonomuraea terrae TaxID=2530383 RepID=UPI0037BAD6F4
MSKIAKLAKISAGVVSYRVGSDKELTKAVVAHVAELACDMMVPQIVVQPTVSEAPPAYLMANLEFMRLHRSPALLRSSPTATPRTAKHGSKIRRVF